MNNLTAKQQSILENISHKEPMREVLKIDFSAVERLLLDEKGNVKCLDAAEYGQFEFMEVRQFAHQYGIYQFPTTELLELITKLIDGKSCLEIGAGSGSIGRNLGIRVTDSHSQTRPEVAKLYREMGQPIIKYPSDVEKLNAKEAIKKYRPKVVLACWLTQLYDRNRHDEGGNMHGVDLEWVFDRVDKMIFVGNSEVHKNIRIPKGAKVKSWKSLDFISRSLEGDNIVMELTH
jgi:hypothetical protein